MRAPGIYDDISDEEYHADRTTLSTSGAKLLLPPSCPAKFRHAMDNPQPYKKVWDFGKIVHRLVLGRGEDFEVILALNKAKEPYEAADLKTVSARESEAGIRAAGKIPVLRADLDLAEACAAAVRAHPIAAALFSEGKAEQSAYWVDEVTGVPCRARFDWLPEKGARPRLLIPDLKTARSAEPHQFGKAAADYGYAMQADAYRSAAIANGLDPDPAFLFCIVEKEAPHVVTVGQLDEEAMAVGAALNRTARRIYADCTEANRWPGYTDEIAEISLPGYFIHRTEEFAS